MAIISKKNPSTGAYVLYDSVTGKPIGSPGYGVQAAPNYDTGYGMSYTPNVDAGYGVNYTQSVPQQSTSQAATQTATAPAYAQNAASWNAYWAGQQPVSSDQMTSEQAARYGTGVWGSGDTYDTVQSRLSNAGITLNGAGTPYTYNTPTIAATPAIQTTTPTATTPAYAQNAASWNAYWAGQQPAAYNQMTPEQFARYGTGVWGEGDTYETVQSRLGNAGISLNGPATPYTYNAPTVAATPAIQTTTPTATPITTAAPAVAQNTPVQQTIPADWYNQLMSADWYNQLMSAFNSNMAATQGTAEDYNTTSSTTELAQALQDRAMQALNRGYGMTSEEQQALYDQYQANFDQSLDRDVSRLENLFQKYGYNLSPELGGQGISSLEDYFGDRALAQGNFATDLMNTAIAQRNTDEQNALANALSTGTYLYNMDRGNFADTLSLMGFNEETSQNDFNNLLSALGFQTDVAQTDFTNQQGISDRTTQDYLDALNALWGQTTDSASLNDSMLSTWANYLSGTEASPDSLVNALTWLNNSKSDIYGQGINAWAGNNSYDALLTALGSVFGNMFQQGDTTNVNTGAASGDAGDGGVNWGDWGEKFGLPDGANFEDFLNGIVGGFNGLSVPDWINDTLGNWGVTTPWGSVGTAASGGGGSASAVLGPAAAATIAYVVGSALPNAINMSPEDAQLAVEEYITGQDKGAQYNLIGQKKSDEQPVETDYDLFIYVDSLIDNMNAAGAGIDTGAKRDAIKAIARRYYKSGQSTAKNWTQFVADMMNEYPNEMQMYYQSIPADQRQAGGV